MAQGMDRLASWEMACGHACVHTHRCKPDLGCLQQLVGCCRYTRSLGEVLGALGFTLGPSGLKYSAHACPLPSGVLGSPLISLLFWILICFSIAALFTKRYSVRPLIVALILRSIYYLGIGPTLNILGALNVSAARSLATLLTC